MPEQINNTPPPFDPDKEKKQREKKTIIAICIVLVLIVVAGFFGLKEIVGSVIRREVIIEEVKDDVDYRLLNSEAEYIANEDLEIYSEPNKKQEVGEIEEDELFYCKDLAYIDESEELWGQLNSGWVLIRDMDENYAKENIVQPVDEVSGELEITSDTSVYEIASTKSRVIEDLVKGDTIAFDYLGEDQKGNRWYALDEGWIQEKDAKIVKEESQKETSEDSTSQDDEEAYVLAKANYDMKIRKEPNLQADRTGSVKEGETIKIVETKEGENESLWGKISDGNWVCLYDKEYDYFDEVDEDEQKDTTESKEKEGA